MDSEAIMNAKQITPDLFGDTDIAGGIPHEYRPSPSNGPVYFERQLVLALSFQGGEDSACDSEDTAYAGNEPLDELRLWDVLSDVWFTPSPTILRYEDYDAVIVDGAPIYHGAVDTTCDVTSVPGWDRACMAINNQCYLRWKPCSN